MLNDECKDFQRHAMVRASSLGCMDCALDQHLNCENDLFFQFN